MGHRVPQTPPWLHPRWRRNNEHEVNKMATTSYEDALRERFERFCDEHGFSRKYVATCGIELFIEQYESDSGDE